MYSVYVTPLVAVPAGVNIVGDGGDVDAGDGGRRTGDGDGDGGGGVGGPSGGDNGGGEGGFDGGGGEGGEGGGGRASMQTKASVFEHTQSFQW